MPDQSSDRNPIDELAEEFVERYRRGERPALSEYTKKHPSLAGEIRDVFPALLMMEDIRPAKEDVVSTGEPGSSPLLEGKKLERLGDYRILREVGRGGMGIVYEAEQESLGRHVALKVLPSHALLDPQRVRRFEREAKAVARLHHTNIVPVFGVGEDQGLHYYVMQFIPGQSLDQVLMELRKLKNAKSASTIDLESGSQAGGGGPVTAVEVARTLLTGVYREADCEFELAGEGNRGAWSVESVAKNVPDASRSTLHAPRLTPADFSSFIPHPSSLPLSDTGRHYWQSVARLGIQVADALAYAHSQGTLHRDIKPSNLLLDPYGTVWVTDFGLAKAADSNDLTNPGDIVGTVRYMAPERFGGKSDVRSDIYGLGITLFEMLILRPAFDESDRSKLVAKILHEEPPRPRKTNPLVPKDLETIVLKAMAKEPAHRYDCAADMAADLRRFTELRPIRARRVSAVERLWRWGRRNPLVAALVLSLVLVVALLAGGVGWITRDRAARETALDAEVTRDLNEAEKFVEDGNCEQAQLAVDRAKQLLLAANRPRPPDRLDELQRDLVMARRLEEIYGQPKAHEFFTGREQDAEYLQAFRDYGIDVASMSAGDAAERIRASHIRLELARALDFWSAMRRRAGNEQPPDWKQLLELAGMADPDPWRNRLRGALRRDDKKALQALASSADVRELPAQTLTLLGRTLAEYLDAPAQAATLLRQAQRQYPSDLWINDTLGWLYLNLQPPQYDEAARFYTAALALRPHTPFLRKGIGEAWLAKGALAEAIAEFSKIIEQSPEYRPAWVERADVYKQLRQWDRAIIDYSKAIELDPKNAWDWTNRGWAYVELHDYDKALADFDKAIELDPKLPWSWHVRGWAHYHLHLYDQALSDFNKAIELDPKLAGAWNGRGCAYDDLRLHDKALADMNKAIELDPKFAGAYGNRGDIYNHIQRYDLAVADCSEAIRLDPKLSGVWIFRGESYLGKGQWDKALADFSKAIELAPKEVWAWTQRGRTYISLHKYDKALADFNKAIELDPLRAGTWIDRGSAYQTLGQWRKAISDFQEAARLQPEWAHAHYNLGRSCAELGEFDRAIPAFQEFLKLLPGNPDAYNEAAWCLAAQSNLRLSEADFAVELAQKATALAPKTANNWNTLGVAHYRAGHWQKTIEALTRSMELSGGKWESLDTFFLAMAHWRQGDKEGARRWYDRAVQWLERNKELVARHGDYREELRRFRAEATKLLGVQMK